MIHDNLYIQRSTAGRFSRVLLLTHRSLLGKMLHMTGHRRGKSNNLREEKKILQFQPLTTQYRQSMKNFTDHLRFASVTFCLLAGSELR